MDYNSTIFLKIDDLKNDYVLISSSDLIEIEKQISEIFSDILIIAPPENIVKQLIEKANILS